MAREIVKKIGRPKQAVVRSSDVGLELNCRNTRLTHLYGIQFLILKFCHAISRVKWLKGEKTNVSKTFSVPVLRIKVKVVPVLN